MIHNPAVIVGPDGRAWCVDSLRLALPAYRLMQRIIRTSSEVSFVASAET